MEEILSWIGTISGILLNISPVLMIYNLYIGNLKYYEMPYLYFISNVLCNVSNICYGIATNEDMIKYSSALGLILALFWLIIFLYKFHFPDDSSVSDSKSNNTSINHKESRKFILHLIIIINIVVELFYFLIYVLTKEDLKKNVSFGLSAVFCVINALTPGQKAKEVWQKYDKKLLPIITIFFGFFCTFSWTIFSILNNHDYLIISNASASCLSLIFIIIYFRAYYKGKHKVFIENYVNDDDNLTKEYKDETTSLNNSF